MDNLQSQIDERINAMVGEVLVLVRRAAIEAVGNALSGTGAIGTARQRGLSSERRGRTPVAQNRRTPEELASVCARLHAAIEEAPGEGMAVYAKQLGLSVREQSRPTQQLKKAGRVRTAGERDRTRYFPIGPMPPAVS